jgi:hypothetical protein
MPDFANAVFVDNNIAYVAGGLSGVVLFDVTDPALPFPLGSYNPLTPVFSVEVDNGVVYVGGTDKLSTFRAPVLRRSDMLFDRPPAN